MQVATRWSGVMAVLVGASVIAPSVFAGAPKPSREMHVASLHLCTSAPRGAAQQLHLAVQAMAAELDACHAERRIRVQLELQQHGSVPWVIVYDEHDSAIARCTANLVCGHRYIGPRRSFVLSTLR